MTLKTVLEKLTEKGSYPEDYIQIIYENAWQVHFVCNSKVKATGVHTTDLREAALQVLRKV